MKAVILAGGLGTRISEESHLRPKPMIEIGGKPILWHIMKIYAAYGVCDFIICLGYKGYMIKEFFANYVLHHSNITVDTGQNRIDFHQQASEPWRVTLIDTGTHTQTGGRLKRIASYLQGDKAFYLTYGDGVADINISALTSFHHQHGRLATVTAVQPPGRFGALGLDGHHVTSFAEKTKGDGGYINGGFFVLSPQTLDYIDGDDTLWELEPLETLAAEGNLAAYHHEGFWRPMDTLRDKNYLESLYSAKAAPWKVWEEV
jgi:glucose-1-phosphate cytidylyltransferase